MVGDKRWKAFEEQQGRMEELTKLLEQKILPSRTWKELGFPVREDSAIRSGFDLLRLADTTVDSVLPFLPSSRLDPDLSRFDPKTRERVTIQGSYAPYILQQQLAARAFERDEHLELPSDMDYHSVSGLSVEEKDALSLVRPGSVGMARRVEGVTPAGALSLLRFVRKRGKPAPKEMGGKVGDHAFGDSSEGGDAVRVQGLL